MRDAQKTSSTIVCLLKMSSEAPWDQEAEIASHVEAVEAGAEFSFPLP